MGLLGKPTILGNNHMLVLGGLYNSPTNHIFWKPFFGVIGFPFTVDVTHVGPAEGNFVSTS